MSIMNTKLLARPVEALPVGAVHMDDDTECTAPEVCRRLVYWPGGAPASLAACDPAEQ